MNNMTTNEFKSKLFEAAEKGLKITATKLVHDYYKLGLKESKEKVDNDWDYEDPNKTVINIMTIKE